MACFVLTRGSTALNHFLVVSGEIEPALAVKVALDMDVTGWCVSITVLLQVRGVDIAVTQIGHIVPFELFVSGAKATKGWQIQLSLQP